MSSEQATRQTEVSERLKQKKINKVSYKKLYKNEVNRRKNVENTLEKNKIELELLKKKLYEHKIVIETLEQDLETKNKELTHLKKPKGSRCSVNGSQYEKKIHNITTHCYFNDKPFNTQKEEELAGSSSKNDIECNFIEKMDIGIEAKIHNTPDWMQCSIKYDKETKSWKATKKSKIPIECREMFNTLINNINLYDGEIPPFIEKSLTHEEWVKIKGETNKWNDKYIDIPSDSISKLYQAKGCNYIQISDGYGLFHLGNDICNFNVPLFNIEQQIRIRTKIHTRKNKKGFCILSVTVACQPKNIKKIIQSKYSLDDKDKIPPPLIYKL